MMKSRPDKLAYHYVPGKYIGRVLGEGEILPAALRLYPGDFINKCGRQAEDDVLFKIPGRPGPSKKATEYFRRLVEEKVEEMRAIQKRLGIQPRRHISQFTCTDFLAGDPECVFLSLGWWVGRGGPGDYLNSGFVFDALELVRAGAVVRTEDILVIYQNFTREIVMQEWKSFQEFSSALLIGYEEIRRSHSFGGKDAIAFVEQYDDRKWHLVTVNRPELLWCGSLPVDLAVEVAR